jgi:hypothetical protein
MAKSVFTDAYVLLNAQNISANVQSVAINFSLETVDLTAMGDLNRNLVSNKLGAATIDLTLVNDYADNALDEILWTIESGKAAVAFEVRPTSAVRSASNPGYTGNCWLVGHSPISIGSVGAQSTNTVRLVVTGPVTRSVA